MRPHTLGFFFVAILAGMPFANAQQPARTAPPPPQLEPLEEGEPPSVTINPSSSPLDQPASVTQKRAPGGKVIETRVEKGGNTYYVMPGSQPGNPIKDDMQSNSTRPAQWEILQFGTDKDLNKKAADSVNAPQPPSLSAPNK
jgi:hypothetical protein